MNSVIINADDLGMSPGTNKAIFDAFDSGKLTHASIMTNGDYFEEAVNGVKERKGLGVGVHLNLSYGKSLLENELLHDEEGLFDKGFLSIYLEILKKEEILSAIEEELEAQIVRAKDYGISITHLDSHRHVHTIPKIFEIVVKLSKKHGVPRIRTINENIFRSMKLNGSLNFFSNGGIFKYLLLRSFDIKNRSGGNFGEERRFFSILFTGKVSASSIENILKTELPFEIMVHPGYSEIDEKVKFYDEGERLYRISKDRDYELKELKKIAPITEKG